MITGDGILFRLVPYIRIFGRLKKVRECVYGMTPRISKHGNNMTMQRRPLYSHPSTFLHPMFKRIVFHPDAAIVHASGIGQLQANPPVAGLRTSPGKQTLRAESSMGANDMVVVEGHLWDKVFSTPTSHFQA